MTSLWSSTNHSLYDGMSTGMNGTGYSLSDIRTTGENNSFVVTHDSFSWLPYSLVLTAVYGATFFHAPQLKSSYKQMAVVSLVTSLFLVVPFLAYAATGFSWTGMNLKEAHRRMIDERHAVLMGLWMVFSIVQLVAYIIKKQQIHNKVGHVVVNYLLPLIFIELFCNAVRVFWPEKPHILAMGVNYANGWPVPETPEDLSNYERVIYTLASFFAFTTPAIMLMYYCLSNQALDRSNGKKRDIKLHVIYMCCFIYSAMAAGSLRWLIKKSFQTSHCVPQTDTAIAALMQYMGQAWTGFIYTALLTAIYLTLPIETRRTNPGVKWSYLVYMIISTFITPMAGWYSGIPFGIQCVTEQQ
jgi:hypothetical protein